MTWNKKSKTLIALIQPMWKYEWYGKKGLVKKTKNKRNLYCIKYSKLTKKNDIKIKR